MLDRRLSHAALMAALLVPLQACGGSPPTSEAREAVHDAVFADNPQAYDAGPAGAEVLAVEFASWKREPAAQRTPGLPARYESSWTAQLRLKEPLAVILQQVNGTKIVQIVAGEGEKIPFQGTIGAMKFEGEWNIDAFSSGEPWKPTWERAGEVTLGYQVIDGASSNFAFRSTTFVPLSRLEPCVVEGSDEWEKMMAEAAQKQREAQEAYAERARVQREEAAERQRQQQAAHEAEQKRRQEEAAERQRLAQEAYAETQRKAQEEAKQRAEAARQARLRPAIAPFQSPTGLVLATTGGPAMGAVLLESNVDEEAFTVEGHGIDLRQMPFREFTFEATTDERGIVSYRSSLAETPVPLRPAPDNGLVGTGISATPPTEAERAKLDALIALGKRLGSAAPLTITPEVVEPAALAAREATLQLDPLTGTVLYLDRVDVRVNPLFGGDLAVNRQYAWSKQQVVAVRLADPVRGSGLYYRGLNPTDDLVVTINGVHTVGLASIPKLGAAVIPLPPDLELLDLRLEARGAASARTIGLIR